MRTCLDSAGLTWTGRHAFPASAFRISAFCFRNFCFGLAAYVKELRMAEIHPLSPFHPFPPSSVPAARPGQSRTAI